MYGELASKLISNIHRDNGDPVPAYEYQLVEAIKRENDELYAENVRTSQSTKPRAEPANSDEPRAPELQSGEARTKEIDTQGDMDNDPPNEHDDIDLSEKEIMVMQVRHTAKLFNKRCIIAYHYERLNRLKKLRWEYGNNLPREVAQNLTKEELEWFTKYNDNLFNYMSALNDGQGLDLTLYTCPPKKLKVPFRCLKEYGEFDLDGVSYLLKKDHLYHLPLKQCEKLIHQGVLEHLKY